MSDPKIKFVVKMLNEGKLTEKSAIELVGAENILRVVHEMKNPSPSPHLEKKLDGSIDLRPIPGKKTDSHYLATKLNSGTVAEEHDIDSELADTKAWDADQAKARGITAPPSATKTAKEKYLGSGTDDFNQALERDDAKKSLEGFASPEEIDQLLGKVYQERQDKIKAIRDQFAVRTESMEHTGRQSSQKHTSGLSRKDFNSRMAKRGL